jgi:hypothetical protein
MSMFQAGHLLATQTVSAESLRREELDILKVAVPEKSH